jgi:hypothetical protein
MSIPRLNVNFKQNNKAKGKIDKAIEINYYLTKAIYRFCARISLKESKQYEEKYKKTIYYCNPYYQKRE